MKNILCNLVIASFLTSLISCNKDEILNTDRGDRNYKIEEASISKSENNITPDSTGLYRLYTPWGNYQKVYLQKSLVKELNQYSTMQEPTIITAFGCNKYELIGKSYKMAINGYKYVENGYYIVQDCNAYLDDIFMPNAPIFVIPQDSPNCGYDPNALINRGFKVTKKSNGLWQFQTRVVMIISNLLGQKINKTIPVELNSIEWNYAYFSMISRQKY
jgi:hypothetical protein